VASARDEKLNLAWASARECPSAVPTARALRSAVVAEERITFLNLRAVNRSHLFEAARMLNGPDEPRGPALVVAQAAVEVGFETPSISRFNSAMSMIRCASGSARRSAHGRRRTSACSVCGRADRRRDL
jgi:hypothetical protein